jgi:hypothetical protein
MNGRVIDISIKPLFQRLEETGIPLDEEKLNNLIRRSQQQLAEQKQRINREAGFTVNLYSEDHWNRALDEVQGRDSFLLEQLKEALRISFLIRRLSQIHDLANGNHKVLGRQFGLYPKYGLDMDRKIITTSEFSIDNLPEKFLGIVGYSGMVLIKAIYPDITLSVIQKLSGDPWITEATVLDLVKLGFVNLFEDYRIGKLGCQIFAVSSCSIYLFAPDAHIDLILSVVRECLENVHPDFTLSVDVTMGISLDRLA